MKLDRAFLEDIMNNKPHGYGKQFMKNTKNKKTYQFVAKITKRVLVDEVTVEVFSTEKDSYAAAKAKLWQMQIDKKAPDGDDIVWRKVV